MTGLRAGTALLAVGILAAGHASPQESQPLPVPERAFFAHLNGTTLDNPLGLHYDRFAGELFVADTGNRAIGIFDTDGMPEFAFGLPRDMGEPLKVMTDRDGRIYVIESSRLEVRLFSYRGEPRGSFAFRDADGPVEVRAVAMASAPDGRLLFGDQLGKRVLVYDRNGSFVRSFGHAGEGRGAFAAPIGIALGPAGEIVVSDRMAIPIQVFSADGRVLRSWGEHDVGAHNFSAPAGVAVDTAGRVYVADTLRQDIKVFDAEGRFLYHFGGLGTGAGQVAYPVDVAVASDGRIFVLEKVGRRVQVFLPPTGASAGGDPTSDPAAGGDGASASSPTSADVE